MFLYVFVISSTFIAIYTCSLLPSPKYTHARTWKDTILVFSLLPCQWLEFMHTHFCSASEYDCVVRHERITPVICTRKNFEKIIFKLYVYVFWDFGVLIAEPAFNISIASAIASSHVCAKIYQFTYKMCIYDFKRRALTAR